MALNIRPRATHSGPLVCLAALMAGTALGCGDPAADGTGESVGALEALGEYIVTSNTCGPHWEGAYAFSVNRIAQFGQGTDQLFIEPTDPSSPANRGRGDLGERGDFSLQISFSVDGQLLVYECSGALDSQAALVDCEAVGQGSCYLAFTSD